MFIMAPDYPAGKDALVGFKRGYKTAPGEEVYTKLGQIDYAAELAQIRAAKPDAVYIFLPGGMGINFVKQFVSTGRSEEHTSELQSHSDLVCRLLLEKKKKKKEQMDFIYIKKSPIACYHNHGIDFLHSIYHQTK